MSDNCERPSTNKGSVKLEAAKALAPKIIAWVGEGYLGDEDLIPSSPRMLSPLEDGYRLARRMEMGGYEPDTELVEILDEVPHLILSAHRKEVAEWLKFANLVAPKIGSKVLLQGGTGEIISNDEVHGTCLVYVKSSGHVRKGNGTHGIVKDWEKLECAQ